MAASRAVTSLTTEVEFAGSFSILSSLCASQAVETSMRPWGVRTNKTLGRELRSWGIASGRLISAAQRSSSAWYDCRLSSFENGGFCIVCALTHSDDARVKTMKAAVMTSRIGVDRPADVELRRDPIIRATRPREC